MVLLTSLVHEIGNESVPKIIVNDTIKFFSQTAISTLVSSNHNSFRVLFDKLLLCILFEKYINVLALQWTGTVPAVSALLFPVKHASVERVVADRCSSHVRIWREWRRTVESHVGRRPAVCLWCRCQPWLAELPTALCIAARRSTRQQWTRTRAAVARHAASQSSFLLTCHSPC